MAADRASREHDAIACSLGSRGSKGLLIMGKPKLCLWKCEACGGWFDLRAVPDREQRLRGDFGMECSCPDPNLQERLEANAVDRVMRACQSTADEISRIRVDRCVASARGTRRANAGLTMTFPAIEHVPNAI
jgi:hypothetical protein